tara:strand:+ start:94 stop:675 length:582 start_codon:yes stop_codon:yes gene_type:complete
MNKNLILFISLIIFFVGLYALNNLIRIIDVNQARDVYMHNKDNKIKMVKNFHKAAKENYIFSKMMENNKDGLIDAVIKNHPKFWDNNKNGISVGLNSKFDLLIQKIISENDLKFDLLSAEKLGKGKYVDKSTQLYQMQFKCEYEDLIVLISELEKNSRIYNIEDLKIKNPIQKNYSGIDVTMRLTEINLGKTK